MSDTQAGFFCGGELQKNKNKGPLHSFGVGGGGGEAGVI
jgi:hypothetical protein